MDRQTAVVIDKAQRPELIREMADPRLCAAGSHAGFPPACSDKPSRELVPMF